MDNIFVYLLLVSSIMNTFYLLVIEPVLHTKVKPIVNKTVSLKMEIMTDATPEQITESVSNAVIKGFEDETTSN